MVDTFLVVGRDWHHGERHKTTRTPSLEVNLDNKWNVSSQLKWQKYEESDSRVGDLTSEVDD